MPRAAISPRYIGAISQREAKSARSKAISIFGFCCIPSPRTLPSEF